jgi:hypothetical protein
MKTFNLSRWALEHKSFVVYLMLLVTLAGIFEYRRLGRDEDPPFTIKTMVVKTLWPSLCCLKWPERRFRLLRSTLQVVRSGFWNISRVRWSETSLRIEIEKTAAQAGPLFLCAFFRVLRSGNERAKGKVFAGRRIAHSSVL